MSFFFALSILQGVRGRKMNNSSFVKILKFFYVNYLMERDISGFGCAFSLSFHFDLVCEIYAYYRMFLVSQSEQPKIFDFDTST